MGCFHVIFELLDVGSGERTTRHAANASGFFVNLFVNYETGLREKGFITPRKLTRKRLDSCVELFMNKLKYGNIFVFSKVLLFCKFLVAIAAFVGLRRIVLSLNVLFHMAI